MPTNSSRLSNGVEFAHFPNQSTPNSTPKSTPKSVKKLNKSGPSLTLKDSYTQMFECGMLVVKEVIAVLHEIKLMVADIKAPWEEVRALKTCQNEFSTEMESIKFMKHFTKLLDYLSKMDEQRAAISSKLEKIEKVYSILELNSEMYSQEQYDEMHLAILSIKTLLHSFSLYREDCDRVVYSLSDDSEECPVHWARLWFNIGWINVALREIETEMS